MSQQPGQHPEDDRRGQYGGYGYDQDQVYDQQQYGYDPGYGSNAAGQGHDQNYAQQYGGGQQGGYGYDPGYGSYAYDQGGNVAGQQYDPGYGYDQGGYGYDQGYDQGGYGYDQGGNVAGQGYDQNYAQQYGGGQQGGYGYDPGYDPGYGAVAPGYPADVPGYAPPAVQTGPRQLTAVLLVDDGSNRTYQLIQGSNVVGRGQDAQFRLPDTGVSRRHLEITWDGRHAMLADLGSTNGTMVNGTPVQTWQLADGDVVHVGHSSLVFRTQG